MHDDDTEQIAYGTDNYNQYVHNYRISGPLNPSYKQRDTYNHGKYDGYQ